MKDDGTITGWQQPAGSTGRVAIVTGSSNRIVNVSSMAHKAGDIDLEALGWDNRSYKPMKGCGDSKIENRYLSFANFAL